MRRAWVVVLSLLFPAASLADLPAKSPARIDPAGIPGSLLLAGEGELPAAVLTRFAALTGSGKEKIVVIAGPGRKKFWDAKATADRFLFSLVAPDQAGEVNRLFSGIPDGVWLDVDEDTLKKLLLDVRFHDWCRDTMNRGGVLAVTGSACRLVGQGTPGFNAEPFLPGCAIRTLGVKDGSVAGLVTFHIPPETALVVRGRLLEAVGKRSVEITLAPGDGREKRTISLQGKAIQDLTSLRRSAEARAAMQAKPGPPVVEKGTLVIVGGGGTPAGLMKRFVDLAGGAKSHIVILPTANPGPIAAKSGLEDSFSKAGAAKVTLLPGRTLAEVESPDSLEAFRTATGVWFGGGRQWRFVDAYEGTKAHHRIKEVLRRGGVIGGTSAGATIQGDYLCRGSPFDNTTMMFEGYERGLGFLPGVAIDQHFSQRKRHSDMTELMRRRPDLLGIGIDETTAIIVRGQVAEVTGKGSAYFYDAAGKQNGPDHETVSEGGRYDLKERRVVK